MASDSPEPLSIGEDAGEDRFAELSDLALWDKLRCLQNGLDRGAFGGLPDGGKKILRYCSDIRHEIARRKEVFSALPSPFSSPVDRSAHSKPHRAPVSATATGGEAADEDRYAAIRQLPDQELREMLRRLQNGLDTGLVSELPDGGKKWLQYHRAVRLEIARRQASCSALLRRFPAHSEDKQPQHAPASVSPKLLPSGEAWDEDSRIVAVSKVLIFIAMQTEMLPLRKRFQLVEVPADVSMLVFQAPVWFDFQVIDILTEPHGLDTMAITKDYTSTLYGLEKILFLNRFLSGVDSVGTLTAALVTYASIQFLKPDLIINAGTAGGFKAKGAGIGDVFLVSDVAFHDRRIPIPVFDMYGVGARKTFMTPNILKELNLKVGKLSTGDSLDMSPHDVSAILSNGATVKDMEGAAVAHVADMFSTPAIFVKAVTDIVDGKKPTAEEFLQNSIGVTKALDQAVTEVVNFISGKCLSDL